MNPMYFHYGLKKEISLSDLLANSLTISFCLFFFLPHLHMDLSQSDIVRRVLQKTFPSRSLFTDWSTEIVYAIIYNACTHDHQASYLGADNICWKYRYKQRKSLLEAKKKNAKEKVLTLPSELHGLTTYSFS